MKRPVTMVAWLYAPERLSLSEAAALSGPDPALLEFPIGDAGVDARRPHWKWPRALRAKGSLRVLSHQNRMCSGSSPTGGGAFLFL